MRKMPHPSSRTATWPRDTVLLFVTNPTAICPPPPPHPDTHTQFARSGLAPRDMILLFVVGVYHDASLNPLSRDDMRRLEEEEEVVVCLADALFYM